MAEQLTEAHVLGAALSVDHVANPADFVAHGESVYHVLKACIDRLAATLLLLLFLPFAAVIALAIRLESRGPVLFRQTRIGYGGRPFRILKFRTMSVAAPTYSYKVNIMDDRITRVGRWLRRSGLDEVPQLLNVIKGEMSLIGPRPEQPFIVAQFQPWQHVRHSIKPGITGWWQIHHRNDEPLHLNLDYDIYYQTHLSLLLDCQIAWRTVKVMLAGATSFLTS